MDFFNGLRILTEWSRVTGTGWIPGGRNPRWPPAVKLAADPAVIAIAGISCSGKTTLARHLARVLPDAAVLPLDAYYRDLSHLPPPERAAVNFDAPDALDYPLLLDQVECLSRGVGVDRPVYSFTTHTRRATPQRLDPVSQLVVEGLFALYWPALRALYHLSVFVDAPHALCLERRLERDAAERGRSPGSIHLQYERHVRPMGERYVVPTRFHADVVVSGAAPLEESIRRLGLDRS